MKNSNNGRNPHLMQLALIIIGTLIASLIALFVFNYIIDPAVTGISNIEILDIDPDGFGGNKTHTFNMTIENTGLKTANSVVPYISLIRTDTSEHLCGIKPLFSKSLLQHGDIAYCDFDLEIPNAFEVEEIVMIIRILSQEGGVGHYWEYEAKYKAGYHGDDMIYYYESLEKTAP